MAWRVANSLDVLLAEINKAAPNRSKISDGSIGDPSHSSRESDHNPNPAGVVRARDFTHDPAHGCDAGKLAERVRQLGIAGHPALGSGSYVIWNRRIASATQDGTPWNWEPYSGSNPHDHHCHVSVSTAAAGYDSKKAWGVMAAPKPPKPPARLRVATFNVWVGQRGWRLRRNLRRMAKAAGWPHVIALQEAGGLRRAPRGYIKVVADMKRRESDANVLLLRAKDVKLSRRRTLAIDGAPWIGPKKQAKTHPPRVHIGATVEAEGRLWDILGVHRVTSSNGQNEKQRDAEIEQIEAWMKARQKERPGRVIVALGDWNGTPRWLARSVGGVLAMDHIDGAVVVGARVRGVRKLGRQFGSDNHSPVVIDIEEK